MKINRVSVACLAFVFAFVLSAGLAQAVVVFEDNFNDGDATKPLKDGQPFWAKVGGSGKLISEADGHLVLKTSGGDSILSQIKPSDEINFFENPIEITWFGLSYGRSEGVTINQQNISLAVNSKGRASVWSNKDGISLAIGMRTEKGKPVTRISFGYKVNKGNMWPNTVNQLIRKKDFKGFITKVSLKLDGDNYTLKITSAIIGKSTDWEKSGKFTDKGDGIKKKDWGLDGSGNSSVEMSTKLQRADHKDPKTFGILYVDRIVVNRLLAEDDDE